LYTYTAQIGKALSFYGKALKVNPLDRQASLCSLMTYNYADGVDEAIVIDAHHQFGVTLEKKFAQLESCSKTKNRQCSRIRLGYVSQDFRTHSVAYFFKALIENYSKERFEVTCYSDVETPDLLTEEIKCKADHWCDSRLMSDEQLYKQVRSDQIDILVDLVGYAGTGRAELFARKAAPIQVIYLGYPNTSGLSRMDFRITDEWSDPAECTDSSYTETLLRLPNGFLCYTPSSDAPKISELPAIREGKGLRFGSFNSFQKISTRMLKIWASILAAVHDSTLFIKAKPLCENKLCERVWLAFEAEGIDRARVELSGWKFDVGGHLENYSQVDIHLDTFPYNGTTTICEALWQGVPTITLAGDTHRSRVGLSILTQVGLADFIASSEQQYIDLAVHKSRNLVALAELRRRLRERVNNSSLMDRTRFISELEACYEDMYSTLPDFESDTDL
jgi:predicted O-linked N-acetylglucosamine transferase (SPINDLY family)